MTRSDDDLCLAPIAYQSELIASGEISPPELTEAYLRRIERLEPLLGCFALATPDRAKADSLQAEIEIRKGARRGPLHGIPVGLKDLIDTAGIATTANTKVLAHRVPSEDAEVAKRLREAGTVLLGKLQMTEFATGKSYTGEGLAPQPRNPWAIDRFPGGSSSGSAVAVAAGLAGASLGSDTGGSIRAPAAFSGVVGLKPTYGLVSTTGVIPLAWSLDHVGPLTRTVEDCALVMDAIASAQHRDHTVRLRQGIEGLRIGVPSEFIASVDLQPSVRSSFEEALQIFTGVGAELSDVVLPEFADVQAAFLAIAGAEGVSAHRAWLRSSRHLYGRGAWERLIQGLLYTGAEYVDAQRIRGVIMRSVARTFERVEVIAVPSMPSTAPTFEQHQLAPPLPRSPFLDLANLLGAPAISVPCGSDDLGLPIGLNLMGRPLEDATVLRVAATFERATQWHLRHPAIAFGSN